MFLKEKDQTLSSIIQEKRLQIQSNSSHSHENNKSISKKLTSAIIESERRNDEMIYKTQQGGINQTVSCIIEAEKHNNVRINDMINDLPHYRLSRSDIQGIYFPYEMSTELLLQLR